MQIVRDPGQALDWARQARASGRRLGLVPTMGFLHAGHASLMRLARPRCDRLVVSVYVNPLQFGPGEDLDRYPRDPEGDAALCRAEGVDLLFMPPDLYAPGHRSRARVDELSEGLCGARRPGHFEGVATVVGRLFGLLLPDLAVFGEKDFQQLAVLRRLALDLYPFVEVLGAPLVRDADGLALSSRNAYLSPEERRRALSLHRALSRLVARAGEGEVEARALLHAAEAELDVDRLDYLELVDPDTLRPVPRLQGPARALVAAFVGRTRLIDNMAVGA